MSQQSVSNVLGKCRNSKVRMRKALITRNATGRLDRLAGGSRAIASGGASAAVFDHFFITRQAVEDGLGIGIGPLPLLGTDVATGRMMTRLPQIRVRRTGYVALTARDAETTGQLPAFLAWLAAEQGQARPA
jgi:DNA-binding transcriptional LysR family regulator